MGQPIQVAARAIDEVGVFDTDRSLTGQDGVGFGSLDEARAGPGLGAALAVRLFESDGDLSHVFVASNVVSARRSGGWSDEQLDHLAGIIGDFFVFYR